MRISTAVLFLVVSLVAVPTRELRANGGAWQIGVSSTGNAAPSDKKRGTEVTIEEEQLTIDLHYNFAAVEVSYRMRNTGAKVVQDFFFPVERWSPSDGDGEGEKPADLEDYRITADNVELKWKDVPSPEKGVTVKDEHWDDFPPARKLWKKSEIPFAPGQTREVVIRYRAGYSGSQGGVSDDYQQSDQVLVYSLSPAATWKGTIGKGKAAVNIVHPQPDEVTIKQPKRRFQKVNETRFEWEFRGLEPTLADDVKIVARRGYKTYPVRNAAPENEEEAGASIGDYLIQGERYFLVHSDFEAVASSTLPPAGETNYEVKNVANTSSDATWAEGVAGDGIGESITLESRRPLPLEAILIMPGYQSSEDPSLWEKNNRVAELEVTLNDEKTFTAKIPDEKFSEAYPLLVRDYAKPVRTVKLVIKAVHPGTAARDTCISSLGLKAKLAQKPEFNPAR